MRSAVLACFLLAAATQLSAQPSHADIKESVPLPAVPVNSNAGERVYEIGIGSAPAKQQHTPFFAFGDPQGAHPLRTTKEVFTSKTFIIVQAMAYGAAYADYHYTNNSPTLRPRPKGTALAIDLWAPEILTTGFYYIADRFTWRPIGIGAESYGIVIHSHDAITGRYH